LEYALNECELVKAAGRPQALNSTNGASQIQTRDWYAWNNLMPPRPDTFHVTGEVQVASPGVEVLLVPRIPQGTNQRILILDIVLSKSPESWEQKPTWKPARYEKSNVTYDRAELFYNNNQIISLPVDNVQ
jgi:hypothetical protein